MAGRPRCLFMKLPKTKYPGCSRNRKLAIFDLRLFKDRSPPSRARRISFSGLRVSSPIRVQRPCTGPATRRSYRRVSNDQSIQTVPPTIPIAQQRRAQIGLILQTKAERTRLICGPVSWTGRCVARRCNRDLRFLSCSRRVLPGGAATRTAAPIDRHESGSDDLGCLQQQLSEQLDGNIDTPAQKFGKGFVRLRAIRQGCHAGFRKACSRVIGKSVEHLFVAPGRQNVCDRFVEVTAARNRQQMSLILVLGDFD
jgi:hypothetical protein